MCRCLHNVMYCSTTSRCFDTTSRCVLTYFRTCRQNSGDKLNFRTTFNISGQCPGLHNNMNTEPVYENNACSPARFICTKLYCLVVCACSELLDQSCYIIWNLRPVNHQFNVITHYTINPHIQQIK